MMWRMGKENVPPYDFQKVVHPGLDWIVNEAMVYAFSSLRHFVEQRGGPSITDTFR